MKNETFLLHNASVDTDKYHQCIQVKAQEEYIHSRGIATQVTGNSRHLDHYMPLMQDLMGDNNTRSQIRN